MADEQTIHYSLWRSLTTYLDSPDASAHLDSLILWPGYLDDVKLYNQAHYKLALYRVLFADILSKPDHD